MAKGLELLRECDRTPNNQIDYSLTTQLFDYKQLLMVQLLQQIPELM
jgi:hypothetical protein